MNKNYFLIILLILILSPGLTAQNFWEKIESPTNAFLRTLHFADSSRGWVAGDSGLIFYTSDGGLNWIQQPTGSANKVMDLFFLDDNRGWGLAWADDTDELFYGTYILKTVDGGQNWAAEQYREENIFMNAIYFLDTLKGFMGGNPGEFVRTTDGGLTWQDVSIDTVLLSHFPVKNIDFYNEQYGFATGGRIDIAGVVWKTTNGGNFWTVIDTAYTPPDEIWDIHFFDSLNIIACGGDPELFGVGFLKSSDAGESWEYRDIGVFGVARAISFRTENEGWCPVPISESLVATYDYGNTWSTYPSPDGSSIYDLVFTDSLHGYAVGDGGVVLKYAARPIISNVTRNPVEINYGEPVTVTANIKDINGVVTDAKLFYGINLGNHIELNMINISGDLYQAVIPAQNDSCIVDFFIRATDNEFNVSLSPKDTLTNRYFYLVLNRSISIQDVQYSPFGGGKSSYNNYEVTLRGIVIADTSDIQGDGVNTGPTVYIQNGKGSWSGIWISGLQTLSLKRGDDVTVTGMVEESSSVTRITGIDDPSDITVHSTLNPLPEPELLFTSTIDLLIDGSVQAEQWEGVLINFKNVIVTDENADGNPGPGDSLNNNIGEILIADTSFQETRVKLQDGTHRYHNFWEAGQDTIPGLIRIQTGDTLEVIKGILFFSSGNYKLIPRKDDDFDKTSSFADKDIKGLPEKYFISQNYPNPFNPVTNIDYALPVEGIVTIKVYDILGREVKILINNERKSAGEHTIKFDAGNLTTGIYFYNIKVGNFNRTMKMVLLK